MTSTISKADVFKAISDEKSLDLFRTIAFANGNGAVLISKTKLTRKRYYSRMSEMAKAGLIKRKTGKHFLTSLGKVVYEAQTIIENAVKDYWKLKAIDSILLEHHGPNLEERSKILDSLMDNQKIKEILLQEKNE